MITIDIEPPGKSDEASDWMRHFIREAGDYFGRVAHEPRNFSKSKLTRVNINILKNAINETFIGRPDVRFLPLFNFVYADGHRMLTIGGMIGSDDENNRISGCDLGEETFVRRSLDEEPFEIFVPILTRKEKIYLDSMMPCRKNWKPRDFELTAEEVAAYRIAYRYFPSYFAFVLLEPPYCHSTILRYEVQRTALTYAATQCFYFRLWITNRGKTRADRVQVFAARLFRKTADGSFKEDRRFLPMNLRWAHSHSREPGGGPEVYAEGISPDMGKHCDLGHITDPSYRAELGESLEGVPATDAIFALDLEVNPNTKSHLLSPGTYRLDLQIAAANSRPVNKHVEVTVTGRWFSDEQKMFHDGIGLRVIP